MQQQLQPSQTSGFASSLPPPTASEPLTGKKKKKRFNTTHLQSPSNTALRSQVKPLCLHLTSKTNTPQFRSIRALEYKCVKGAADGGGERNTQKQPAKWNRAKTPNNTHAAAEQYECLLVESFISFVFISLLLSLSLLSMQQVLSYALGLRGAD